MPQVSVPPPFRGPTRGRAKIEVEASTVRECVDAIEALYPGFRELILDPQGLAQPFITVFLNGDEIGRDALGTSVGASDRVDILTSVAGG